MGARLRSSRRGTMKLLDTPPASLLLLLLLASTAPSSSSSAAAPPTPLSHHASDHPYCTFAFHFGGMEDQSVSVSPGCLPAAPSISTFSVASHDLDISPAPLHAVSERVVCAAGSKLQQFAAMGVDSIRGGAIVVFGDSGDSDDIYLRPGLNAAASTCPPDRIAAFAQEAGAAFVVIVPAGGGESMSTRIDRASAVERAAGAAAAGKTGRGAGEGVVAPIPSIPVFTVTSMGGKALGDWVKAVKAGEEKASKTSKTSKTDKTTPGTEAVQNGAPSYLTAAVNMPRGWRKESYERYLRRLSRPTSPDDVAAAALHQLGSHLEAEEGEAREEVEARVEEEIEEVCTAGETQLSESPSEGSGGGSSTVGRRRTPTSLLFEAAESYHR